MKTTTGRYVAAAALLLATVVGVAVAVRWDSPPGSRRPAPDVPYTLLDGSPQRTGALHGQVLLVSFWATSCASCVKAMPELVATHRQFESQGFATLAVAMSYDPPAYVVAFAERRALPFAVAIDLNGAIARGFGDVRLTPTHVLIDRQGRVVERHVGPPDFAALRERIGRLLAET